MLELNLNAKPFNPCEELLGLKLSQRVEKSVLVGAHAYLENPTSPKDYLCLIRPSNWGYMVDGLMGLGYVEELGFGNICKYIHPTKPELGYVFVTHDWNRFQKFQAAVAVCKYLKLTDKEHILAVHKLTMEWSEVNNVHLGGYFDPEPGDVEEEEE